MEMVHLQLSTPNGTSLMGAATYPQLEQTSMKEWFEIIPKHYIKEHNKSKNYVDLINGHRVLFRSLDDEGKARSLNLCFVHIEEASEVKFEYYVQLLTRLRNRATKNHKMILSTNPEMNWVKNEILLKAGKIHNAERDYSREMGEINPNISVHIAPTKLNTHLPPNFYADTAKGRESWWINRFLHGSFENKQGLVYPQAMDHVVEPFPIPKHWQRYQGVDFGLQDPTVSLWAAIDPKEGMVYIYNEHYQNEKSVAYHADKMVKHNSTIPMGMLMQPIADPKGAARSERDKRSLFDHYAEYGLYFKPGYNRIEDGIYKVYTYFELGRLKIFSNLKNTIDELQKYKYPPRKLGDDEKVTEKPLDKDNHAMDVIRYICGELPDSPFDLINHGYLGSYEEEKKDTHLPFELQDDEDSYESGDWSSYY